MYVLCQKRLQELKPEIKPITSYKPEILKDYEKQISELKKENENLKNQLNELRLVNDKRKIEISLLKEENENLINENTNKEKTILEIENLIKEKDREINSLTIQLNEFKEKLKSLPTLKQKTKVGIFIDGENIFYKLGGDDSENILNMKTVFSKILKGNRKLEYGFAYFAEYEGNKRTYWIREIEKVGGFLCKTKEAIYRKDGTMKCNWDIGICIDIIKNINNLNEVVLVTGDGDFKEFIEYIRETHTGIRFVVSAFEDVSRYLRDTVDEFILLGSKDLKPI